MSTTPYYGKRGDFSIDEKVLTLEFKNCKDSGIAEKIRFSLSENMDVKKIEDCLKEADYLIAFYDGKEDYSLNICQGLSKKSLMQIEFNNSS